MSIPNVLIKERSIVAFLEDKCVNELIYNVEGLMEQEDFLCYNTIGFTDGRIIQFSVKDKIYNYRVEPYDDYCCLLVKIKSK